MWQPGKGLLSEIAASKRMLVVRNRSGNRIAGSIVRCFGGAEFVDLLRPRPASKPLDVLAARKKKKFKSAPSFTVAHTIPL